MSCVMCCVSVLLISRCARLAARAFMFALCHEFLYFLLFFFFFSSRRRHTRSLCDWSSDVCSSDLASFRTFCNRRHVMDDARLTETEMIRLLRDLADQPLPDPDLTNCELITRIRRQIGRASCRERV